MKDVIDTETFRNFVSNLFVVKISINIFKLITFWWTNGENLSFANDKFHATFSIDYIFLIK